MSDVQPREIVVTVAAPVEDVWRALREPAEIRRWFGWEYEDMYGLADLDAEVEAIFGAATADDEARTLHFGDDVLRVEERGAETIVRVTRPGPADGDWEGYYDDIAEGWLAFFHQLRFALERHPGEERRTLHLIGVVADDRPAPIRALGLEGLGEAGAYESVTPFGATLAGDVWFRADLQLGLTVASLGDGLLVVTEQPLNVEPPRYASATLTTYRLDDDSFETLRNRWMEWWSANYLEPQVLARP